VRGVQGRGWAERAKFEYGTQVSIQSIGTPVLPTQSSVQYCSGAAQQAGAAAEAEAQAGR